MFLSLSQSRKGRERERRRRQRRRLTTDLVCIDGVADTGLLGVLPERSLLVVVEVDVLRSVWKEPPEFELSGRAGSGRGGKGHDREEERGGEEEGGEEEDHGGDKRVCCFFLKECGRGSRVG